MTKHHRDDTVLVHAGRDPQANHGIVNPPVYHASTILFPSVEEMDARTRRGAKGYTYARRGTPTSEAFEQAVAELEGGYGAVSLPSGLAAVTMALGAFLKAGDHLLMTDSVYEPTRIFCDRVLARYGVATTYYDPLAGAGIAGLIRPETRVIFLESPGSQTFEVQDVPAIAAAAQARGIVTLMDNTWATPLFFRAPAHGVSVSIHAATKYLVGHADASMGVIVCDTEETWRKVKAFTGYFGQCAGPDDLYLAQRGLRTLRVRLERHQASALHIARWLQTRPEVDRVLFPALPDDPGYALWRRDFTGASGLFGVVLKPVPKEAVAAMLDSLELFPLGFSWGGYESLSLPADPARHRTATRWTGPGPLLRLHIGLEDPADLIADLEAGFARLTAAAAATAAE